MKAPVCLQPSQLPAALSNSYSFRFSLLRGRTADRFYSHSFLEFLSICLHLKRKTQSGGDARISFKSVSLDGHLWHRSPKPASRADGEKTDSLQGRSDDCIQTVWQSTLISPCRAVWCYWAQPCTSVSLQCTQWAKPTELMGDGRELWGRRRERGEEWMMCHTP